MRDPNPDQIALQQFTRDPRQAPTFDANPMARALGARLLAVDGETGMVRVRFEPDGTFVQGAGVLQGGALTAMLDFSMAFALMAVLSPDQTCATVSLTVSFLRAAPRGRYVALGEIERRGRQVAFARARLFAEDQPDRIVATATSVLAIVT